MLQLSDDNLVFSVTEVTEIPENPSSNVLIKICVIIVSSRDELFNFNYNTFAENPGNVALAK
jgi:hypothetical protein